MNDVEVSDPSRIDWERVYRTESPRLWRSLVLSTGSREIASDAVAEAFAQAITLGDSVRKPGAWVWKAAFMIARGELSRMHTDELSGHPAQPPPPDSMIDLVRALSTLSVMQREATVLHYFAGYSVAETAVILGSTRSAVGVHLFRARGKLRDALGDDDEH